MGEIAGSSVKESVCKFGFAALGAEFPSYSLLQTLSRQAVPRIDPSPYTAGGILMRIFSRMFSRSEADLDNAERFLDEAERLADNGNPLLAMEYLQRRSRGMQKLIGPAGPLHERFVRILHKVRSRVFASNPDAPRKVERNWANLPSVLQIPLLGENGEIRSLLHGVKANNKDLVWLVPAASLPTQQDVKTMIDYTFHFADNPRLVVQFHEWNGNFLIRRSFLLNIAPQLSSPTIGDFLVDIIKLATVGGWAVETI